MYNRDLIEKDLKKITVLREKRRWLMDPMVDIT